MDFAPVRQRTYPRFRPLPLPISKGYKSLKKERVMNPVFIIAIPLGLVILGMILNSWDLGYNQPPSSAEQDPLKKLTAEKESYRKFFELQRSRSIKRQKRVGQYSWVGLAALIRALILLFPDNVTQTG